MFDPKQYMKSELSQRMTDFPVPDLLSFFSEEIQQAFQDATGTEKARALDAGVVWKVKGLNGEEFALARQAIQSRKEEVRGALIEKLRESAAVDERVNAVMGLTGLGIDTPMDFLFRKECLFYGSVSPNRVDFGEFRPFINRFADEHAGLFYNLTDEIVRLTNMGPESKKKLKNSGVITELEAV